MDELGISCGAVNPRRAAGREGEGDAVAPYYRMFSRVFKIIVRGRSCHLGDIWGLFL